MAPVIVLLLAIVLFAFFYRLLPAEVAFHFDSEGNPDNWISRPMAGVAVLAPQLFLVLLAWGIVWGVTRLNRRFGWAESGGVRTGRVVSFMGNIIALPQFVLLFAMLDILSYNAYQIHIMPMWLFLAIILGLATITLLVLLTITIVKARQRLPGKT